MRKRKAPTPIRDLKDSNQSTDLIAQRHRLLKALRKAGSDGVTTIYARHKLNIMMPATRVHELRHGQGFNVQTIWTNETNPEGYKHRCARYVLMPGKWKGAA